MVVISQSIKQEPLHKRQMKRELNTTLNYPTDTKISLGDTNTTLSITKEDKEVTITVDEEGTLHITETDNSKTPATTTAKTVTKGSTISVDENGNVSVDIDATPTPPSTGGGTTTTPPNTGTATPAPDEPVIVEPVPEPEPAPDEPVIVEPVPEPEPAPDEPVIVEPVPEPEPAPDEPVIVEPVPVPEPAPTPEVKHKVGDIEASSELEGTTTQENPETGDITTKVSTNNENNEDIEIEVVAKTNGDVKASHSLKTDGKETKAESELPNTKTTIKADKSVETTATLNSNGAEIKITAKPDGSATHEVKLGETISQALSEIKGAKTYVNAEGEVETSVSPENYVDPKGYSIKAVVLTNKEAQSFSGFVKEYNGIVQETQPTVSADTPFEAGNTIRVYEDSTDSKLKLEVETDVTRKLQF
jgi:hypothetical protein